jgi:hypothetical protein
MTLFGAAALPLADGFSRAFLLEPPTDFPDGFFPFSDLAFRFSSDEGSAFCKGNNLR